MSRRALLSTAAAAGMSLAAGTASSAEANSESRFAAMKPMLSGCCDIHLHAAPDSKARSLSEYDMALAAREAGYRAVLFKSNDFSCHDRAYLLRQAVPGIELFGSLVLNRCTGPTLNVYAVEQALKTTGSLCRCVWLPTLDAQYQALREGRSDAKAIKVCEGASKLLPEVIRIMELCAEADIILATGHSSPEESLIMAQAAKDMGFKKLVVTHPNTHIWRMTPTQLEKAAELGAWLEYCYLGHFWGPGTAMPTYEALTLESLKAFMSVAPERTFITTDLGQVDMPHPVEGMRRACEDLEKIGFGKKQIEHIVKALPAQLIAQDPLK